MEIQFNKSTLALIEDSLKSIPRTTSRKGHSDGDIFASMSNKQKGLDDPKKEAAKKKEQESDSTNTPMYIIQTWT